MFKPLETLFLLVAAIEVMGELTGNNLIRFIAKPLLMITLIGFYIQAVAGKWNKVHKLMVAAFFFSWIGDVALMFVFKNENFFLLGLVGFLMAHILYAVAFSNVTDINTEPLLPKKFLTIIPLLIYMVVLLALLLPSLYGNEHTKPILIPVIIYTVAISTMVVFSINRYKRVNKQSFIFVLSGALLFMFSDSIIAINKFLSPFFSASIYIMILYILGQYFIAKGVLSQFSKTKL